MRPEPSSRSIRVNKRTGRQVISCRRADGRLKDVLYSRYLMEQHLGRHLEPWEHVDHVDEDKTNDRLENLQVLSNSANMKKHAKRKRTVTMWAFKCPQCDTDFTAKASSVRYNKRKGCNGPFCSRSCSTAWRWAHN